MNWVNGVKNTPPFTYKNKGIPSWTATGDTVAAKVI